MNLQLLCTVTFKPVHTPTGVLHTSVSLCHTIRTGDVIVTLKCQFVGSRGRLTAGHKLSEVRSVQFAHYCLLPNGVRVGVVSLMRRGVEALKVWPVSV